MTQIQHKHEPVHDAEATVRQRIASDPGVCAWVNASAGTGKTSVLTSRVLRLLLPRRNGEPGAELHKILCLTFTKAAASEMALRISRRLSRWAVMPEEAPREKNDLKRDLRDLLGEPPTAGQIEAARNLFAQVTDAHGSLKIMTIHSFCQSVLGRFPLEAKLPPHFKVLEEDQANDLLARAFSTVLSQAAGETASPLQTALHGLGQFQTQDQILKVLQAVRQETRQFKTALERHWGPDGLYNEICKVLEIDPGKSAAQLLQEASLDSAFDGTGLLHAATLLLQSGKTDAKKGGWIAEWLSNPQDRVSLFENYCCAYFKKDGDPYEEPATKSFLKKHPDCRTILEAEGHRLQGLKRQIEAYDCAQQSRDLFTVAQAVTATYETLKSAQAALDFDDLIGRTLDLLQGRTMSMTARDVWPWVMYKLDSGIDHVLIDEAQDTNPEQWDIIRALCDEFFHGKGARETARTLFVVGDRKQSIFSFQRAAPAKFDEMKVYFEKRIRAAGQKFESVDLTTSFRSTQGVLNAVDTVFAPAGMRRGLDPDPLRHTAWRNGQPGHVELWPLFPAQEKEAFDPWRSVLKNKDTRSPRARLSAALADTIAGWVSKKETLSTYNRPVEPRDILVLVRTRTSLVTQIVRDLKQRNIPVSGVDRMVLNEQLAIEDLLALARFALLPEDDLSLACTLKCPLIGLNDDDLITLAPRRAGSLWETLQGNSRYEAVSAYLRRQIHNAGNLRPYEFFCAILHKACPADSLSGLRAMHKRLGDEALDPLDEFLNACLSFENSSIPSLVDFCHQQETMSLEIKRQIEEKGGYVRIMTIHGAKGLQAPIVFLPDCVQGAARKFSPLFWPDKSGLSVPVFCSTKGAAEAIIPASLSRIEEEQDDELRRLLYVAMTRAEERLYIAGAAGKTMRAESWYPAIRRALEAMDGAEQIDFPTLAGESGEKAIRISTPAARPPDKTEAADASTKERPEIPDWACQPAPAERDLPDLLIPSQGNLPPPPVSSPLSDGVSYRYRRGLLTHTLLQYLPDMPGPEREKAARAYLNRQPDIPEGLKESILHETMIVLQHPDFAPVFAPGSLAEVPVSGLLNDKTVISGQIDRLMVRGDGIWIVDYKTNRPPPKSAKAIPLVYVVQMQSYARVLKMIYPNRPVHCALLWTDGPILMPLDPGLINQ